jgi:hypothetical protein
MDQEQKNVPLLMWDEVKEAKMYRIRYQYNDGTGEREGQSFKQLASGPICFLQFINFFYFQGGFGRHPISPPIEAAEFGVAHWGRGKSVLNCQFPICCPGNPSALPAL